MKYSIADIDTENLNFDYKNPRLAEFNFTEKTSPEEVLKTLWEAMSVEEIFLSIASSGFFQHEPLIAVVEKINGSDSTIIIEGNRRLAAVKSILQRNLLEKIGISKSLPTISNEIVHELKKLPVIIVPSREDAWKYIGFKHINGPAKWGSYAKAQYISQIHKDFKVPLNDIALQIGDTHKTVQKLFQGLKVIEQAEQERKFDRTDIKGSRLYFSHLYTALAYDGFRTYLGIKDVAEEIENPVPKEKLEDLKDCLLWLFGSRTKEFNPVILSQNPDLRRLDSVLKNKEAVFALKSGAPLIQAYEISLPGKDIFEGSLLEAKRALQKAHSYETLGYSGEEELLNIAASVSDLAYDLYESMEKRKSGKENKPKRRG